jgi:NAD(P)-dependent dehydrogenase (short-subunit alcohol dehydrogenase family)
MKRLSGKVAVITGGGGEIGLAAAKLFVDEGAKVFLVDLNENGLRNAVDAVGKENASYLVADVTKPEQVQNYVKAAVQRFGGIDVFLNNAAIEGEVKPIVDYSIDIFKKVIDINIVGVWLGLKYVIPEMAKRNGGSIIITSSVAGIKGSPGVSAYCTSKHAVIGMMRSAAVECAPLGIRVNTVNPAPIESRMMRSLEEGSLPGAGEMAKEALMATIPAKRYGTTDEVAKIMLFLSSDESKFCTGGVYMVDGGISAV